MRLNIVQKRPRVLIVGRSPSVLLEAIHILRGKGYPADATNQFDRVLDDFDVRQFDLVVFGGMVPPDTKQHLREQISERNPDVTFVQGLFGIAGLIAAQVQAQATVGSRLISTYESGDRTLQIDLYEPARVVVEAWWATSWTPPEPKSASMVVFEDDLDAGHHRIVMPDDVPSSASFGAVCVGAEVRVFTIGRLPDPAARLVPPSAGGTHLPEVSAVVTSR